MRGHSFTDLAHIVCGPVCCECAITRKALKKSPQEVKTGNTNTQTDWGSRASLPACSYSTVVTIKKLF